MKPFFLARYHFLKHCRYRSCLWTTTPGEDYQANKRCFEGVWFRGNLYVRKALARVFDSPIYSIHQSTYP